ncbi:MAG: membrane dipeptidase [Candidatus Doudnabacteria bacterium]|nr:membrane dipeptidase [Candidatus Doudnabacteria bacterium]
MAYPVIDLHCDLLSFLSEHSQPDAPFRKESRTSLPQLKEGGVALQTLALFTETKKGSRASFERQLKCYEELFSRHSDRVAPFVGGLETGKINTLLAVENASGLLEEGEPFALLFDRIEQFLSTAGSLLYISLTWKTENRFGGGDSSKTGLKREGEILLEYLSSKGIAIDLSHASDLLAHDIFDYIEKKGLSLIPLASHSNFRALCNVPRNLPDLFAKEIIQKKGLLGINFVRHFVGAKGSDLFKMIDYGISIGGEKALAFGADFFGGLTLSSSYLEPFFFPEYEDASCYPKFLHQLEELKEKKAIQRIAFQNVLDFLEFTEH